MEFLFVEKNNRYREFFLHDHGYWEILLSLEGSGVLIADGESYDFHPGTIFCIRPGVMHAKYSEEGYVDGSILARNFCFELLPDKVLTFQDDADQSFLALYSLALRYPGNPELDTPATRFQRSILDAMQNLLRHWRDEAQLSPELAAFQEYLYANISNTQLDMDKAIASTGYSPSHFRRLFRERFHCTPIQYYNQLKIQLAKEELLRNQSMTSIAEIAASCGFKDPDYFSRVFRQTTGISPTQFYLLSRRGLEKERMISRK